ncbi:MAG: HlyD family secretion protein, partial [Planctomycetaceae bacterium]|nr:HlyD family secretion protein [Planctomycetaceae bacterium]
NAVSGPRLGREQVAPLIAKVDMLLHETERIREWIDQGNVKAPVNGTVLHRHHPAGECIRSHEPLFSVIEESSLEIEMFLPQEMADEYSVGDVIQLNIQPFEQLVPCKVVAIGGEYRRPPTNLEIYYRSDITLLPVRVRPAPEFAADKRMTVGAVAKLPHFTGAISL